MAFVLHQTWDATAPALGAGPGLRAPAGPLAPLLANGRDRYFRKSGATLLSVLVHLVLLWLFIAKLAGNAGEGDGAGAGSGTLSSFTLSDPAAASAASADAVEPPRPSVQPASELDATVPTELPPPEWTVSRLPPSPRPQTPPAPTGTVGSAAGASAAAGGAGAGAGNGGSDVYDPFAGAAPLRRERDGQAAAPSLGERVLGFFGLGSGSSGGLTLDEAALEAIRRAVANALPGRRGTAELVVRVSPTGVVLEANARGGSAPPEARDALGRALVGKRLYLGSAVDAQTITLPVLRLG